MFECWTTLAALSQRTSNVRLGQMVGCAPYRNPGLLAKITSNIDVMSGGRLDWGVGAGWYEHEYNGYGYGFPAAKDRIRMLRETVEIVKSMWSEPDTTYDGKFFQLRGAQCDPKPVQHPHPPIWIGGGGEQLTLRVVARHADCSNFGGKPHEFQHKARCCRATAARSVATTTRSSRRGRPSCSSARPSRRSSTPARSSFWGEPFDSWRAGNLVGTPEQVAREDPDVRRPRLHGLRAVVLGLPGHRDVRLFAEKVIPEFR